MAVGKLLLFSSQLLLAQSERLDKVSGPQLELLRGSSVDFEDWEDIPLQPPHAVLERLRQIFGDHLKPLGVVYEAQRLSVPAEEEVAGIHRYRFFRVGSKSGAAYLGNTNVASDVGVLRFIFDGSLTQSSFADAVVGEYHVDVLQFGSGSAHDDFFGQYQMFVNGKDISGNLVWQPGYQGVKNYMGLVSFNGWYSLPKRGECHRSSLDDSIISRTVQDGGCRWQLRERPRLVQYSCLQKLMCEALDRSLTTRGVCPKGGSFNQIQQSLQNIFKSDLTLKKTTEWSLALEGFLSGFQAGVCPEVEEVLACCCRWMSAGSASCDAAGEGGDRAQVREIDGTKYCCKSFRGKCPRMLSRLVLNRYASYNYAMEGGSCRPREEWESFLRQQERASS